MLRSIRHPSTFCALSIFALPFASPPLDLQAQARADRKPNIIFIMADDLGYGDLGCYGQRDVMTPNIDRLAAEGMRFTDCYAGSTVCAPSRSCLMTGTHTGHTRVRGNSPRLPLLPSDVTVAEVLKGAGYATGIVGKWGIGEPTTTGVPNLQGFDSWFGYLNQSHAHNYYPELLFRDRSLVVLRGNMKGGRGEFSHDLFAAEALDFIDLHKDEPFFLYLALTIPHANNEKGKLGMEVPSDAPYSERDWPQAQKNFAAMVTRMDGDVGRIMARLSEHGIDRDTIVFFTSDNGPHREGGNDPTFFSSSGPLRGIKRDLYEGGIRVPMIARWPGKIEAGSVSDLPWAFWDVLPTAAEIAGAPPPGGIDGISVLPTLLGRSQEPHRYLYWEFHERKKAVAVRMGDWKAVVRAPDFQFELYEIGTDPAETTNVAADHPRVVEELKRILAEARSPSPYWPPVDWNRAARQPRPGRQ